jgi:hypothetical protein
MVWGQHAPKWLLLLIGFASLEGANSTFDTIFKNHIIYWLVEDS